MNEPTHNNRPNVLIIMSDQHTASMMGCAGDSLVQTPHLDAFASEGMLFDSAYCPFPLCCPSRMSFLTGRYPSEIDCLDNRVQLSSDLPTFAHAFSVSGYETLLSGRMHIVGPDQHHGFEHRLVGDTPGTAYFNSDWADEVAGPLKGAMGGSRQGFEQSGPGKSGLQTFDERVADITSRWLRNRGRTADAEEARPFLLVTGFFFPHNPWVAPAEDYDLYRGKITIDDLPHRGYQPENPQYQRTRERMGWDSLDVESQIRVRTAYYAMCTTTDRMVGRILAALEDSGLADNTIVVYTSDHGEALGLHGMWGKNTFFEESARVPMIFRWPDKIRADTHQNHPVSLMDVGSTLLELTDSEPLPAASSKSFSNLLISIASIDALDSHGNTTPDAYREHIICERLDSRMIRQEPWKYCYYENGYHELYNLDDDPEELLNLANDPQESSRCNDLRAKATENWDSRRIRETLARRAMELPLIQRWIRTVKPAEPVPPWFDGVQENVVYDPGGLRMSQYMLAIDQGTSSTKTIVFSMDGRAVANGVESVHTRYESNGHVEQDPDDLYRSVIQAVGKTLDCLEKTTEIRRDDITCAGIANQRETFILWDERGVPVYNAVVWQCKRSIDACERLKREGRESDVRERTGLFIDPYFSASKVSWVIENEAQVREVYDRGDLRFGTVDTWLLFRLTGGARFATDHTNASRTSLFNIHTLDWDDALLDMFELEKLCLPSLHPSANVYGESDFDGLFGKTVPISAMIGDSHGALFGERCFSKGDAKATLGTGCSLLLNAGRDVPAAYTSTATTVGFSLPSRTDFALEGVIVSAGSVLTWLRDELGFYTDTEELEILSGDVPDSGGVVIVPGHAGMGAPFWKMSAKGAIHGLTFGSDKRHILRAALETIAYQIRAVLDAIDTESGVRCTTLRVDGGISRNRFVTQWISDTTGIPVRVLSLPDITALGTALLSGLGSGVYINIDQLDSLELEERLHEPTNSRARAGYENWRSVVDRVI